MAEEHSKSNDHGEQSVVFTIVHRGKEETRTHDADDTLVDLAILIEEEKRIPVQGQKYLVPKMGLLKPLADDMSSPSLRDLRGKKITLVGTESGKIESFRATAKFVAHREASRRAARRNAASGPSRRQYSPQQLEDMKYTFREIRPLPNLPNPERSKALLEKLKADPGIRAAMRKHKFQVGLLTEMEPLSNTQSTHEGTTRLLGLNRNHGEVIELRLWTDAYDGYRDYNTIRKTLCHELAHNVHGPHDRQFWDLCHQIEKEVHDASRGHTTSGDSFMPSKEEDAHDDGGWTGGQFVLGSGSSNVDVRNLSRREILARAAEQRQRRMNDDDPNGGNQGPSSGSSP
jgi:hypothetical protein